MSQTRLCREYSLWRYIWKLLHLQWRIFFSGFRAAKLRRKIGYLVLVLVALAIGAAVFATSWGFLWVLRSPELAELVDPTPLLAAVPALIVTIAFFGVLLFSFGVLLQALYLAGDMDFLLSSPVPISAVFVAKLLQAVLPNFGLTLLFGLPVLYGLGAAGGYNVLYYPLVVIVLSAVVLTAAGLASLLVMSIVRAFPARSIAEVLAVLGSGATILCSQSQFFARSVQASETQVSQAFGWLMLLNGPWSPFAWAGRGLVDVGEGRWATGAGLVLLTLGLAGVLFTVMLNTVERLYYTGWARIQSGTRRKRNGRVSRPRTGAAPFAAVVDRLVPAPVRGLVVKDALVLRRDLRYMSQLLSPLLLGVIYAALLVQGGGEPPAGRGQAPAWFMQTLKSALSFGNVVIALFVGWSLLSRLGMMGLSQEGRHYWLLKTAPLSASRLLTAKFIIAFLPPLALGWGFLLIISLVQRAGVAALLYDLLVVLFCIAGGAGIELALGVASANLEWDDPRRMMAGMTGCFGFLVGAIYLIVVLALFFGTPFGFAVLGWPTSAGQLVGLMLGGATSLVCAIVPLRLVSDRVARLGEV